MGQIGRRPVFFLVITAVCLVMVPLTPAGLRYLPWILAGVGAFWTVMLGLDDLFAPVRPRRRAASRLVKRGVITAPPVTMEGGSPLRPPPTEPARATPSPEADRQA